MASQTFALGTVIPVAWLNDVNTLTWGVFNGATTSAQARTALGISFPIGISNGGTGQTTAGAALSALGGAASGLTTASGLTQTTGKLLGRTTASTGAVEEITPSATLNLSGGGLTTNFSPITASLSSDVNLSNNTIYFDGPSVAQGTVGTWFVIGSVTIVDPATAAINAKLSDGTTVIASAVSYVAIAGGPITITLSGFIVSPVGNLRISAKDSTSVNGKMLFNNSGFSKDCTITAIRIA